MATKVYGASDDLIEFEGDCRGEVNCYGTDDRDQGVLVVMSDGTILEIQYGKLDQGIWGITVLRKGRLFERLDQCESEDADPYSDVAHFRDGIKWASAATGNWHESSWETVR